MKARKYYTLLGQFDAASPFEIIFGDYDREVVEQEKEDNENLDSDFGPKKLTIVTTGDKQEDIEDRVTALNNGWSEVNRKRAERTQKVQKCFALVVENKDSRQMEIIFTSKFRTPCTEKNLELTAEQGNNAFITKLFSDTITYQDGWIKKFNKERNANISPLTSTTAR